MSVPSGVCCFVLPKDISLAPLPNRSAERRARFACLLCCAISTSVHSLHCIEVWQLRFVSMKRYGFSCWNSFGTGNGMVYLDDSLAHSACTHTVCFGLCSLKPKRFSVGVEFSLISFLKPHMSWCSSAHTCLVPAAYRYPCSHRQLRFLCWTFWAGCATALCVACAHTCLMSASTAS